MSGGRYQYIHDKDWDFIQLRGNELIRKAIGDAYFNGYEDFASELRRWLKDWNRDPHNTYQYECSRSEFDFTPKNEEVREKWQELKPRLKALSWWMSGDTGEKKFQEVLNE